MGRKVDNEVRIDEVLLFKEDHVAYNIVYYGRTEDFISQDTDAVWQIKRVTTSGALRTVEYANRGKYNTVWADRYSYFTPDPPPEAQPSSEVSTVGLSREGRISLVEINNISWTPLPAIPLLKRNAISIMNESIQKVKLNYTTLDAGFVGMTIFANGGERQYDITDTIMIYAKSQTSSIIITVEELA